jgi:hypothetical protein
MTSQVKASSTIPYVYRFLLLNVEPLFALNGAALVFFQARKYLFYDDPRRSNLSAAIYGVHLYRTGRRLAILCVH